MLEVFHPIHRFQISVSVSGCSRHEVRTPPLMVLLAWQSMRPILSPILCPIFFHPVFGPQQGPRQHKTSAQKCARKCARKVGGKVWRKTRPKFCPIIFQPETRTKQIHAFFHHVFRLAHPCPGENLCCQLLVCQSMGIQQPISRRGALCAQRSPDPWASWSSSSKREHCGCRLSHKFPCAEPAPARYLRARGATRSRHPQLELKLISVAQCLDVTVCTSSYGERSKSWGAAVRSIVLGAAPRSCENYWASLC